jgi:hypothetical protein
VAAEVINVVDWIAREENFLMPESDFSYVSDFTLVWAYAELKIVEKFVPKIFFNQKRKPRSLGCALFNSILDEKEISEKVQWNSILETAYCFFEKRYAGKEGKQRFIRLFPHDPDRKYRDDIWKIISKEAPSSSEKIRATAIICSRLRNNLFHGTKRLQHVLHQGGLIKHAAVGMQGITIALNHVYREVY